MDAIVFDVRKDVGEGKDPFPEIMAAVECLVCGQQLVIISTFQPRPLYKILGQRGFEYRIDEIKDGALRIVFVKPPQEGPTLEASASRSCI